MTTSESYGTSFPLYAVARQKSPDSPSRPSTKITTKFVLQSLQGGYANAPFKNTRRSMLPDFIFSKGKVQ